MSHSTPGHSSSSGAHYETRDLRARSIVVASLVGTAITVAIFIGLYAFTAALDTYVQRAGPTPNPLRAAAPKEPPAPRLQPAPIKDLLELRAWEDSQLHHYAWVDKTNGVVRIPIERAIALLAERGLPARPEEVRP